MERIALARLFTSCKEELIVATSKLSNSLVERVISLMS
jgi:hypothetical protein